MDENIIENMTSPSTNKFIFADAFYNSLEETNLENNSNVNNAPNGDAAINVQEPNTTSQPEEISTNNFNNDLTQPVNTMDDFINNQEIVEEPKEESIDINIDNSLNNMDFLLLSENNNNVETEKNNIEPAGNLVEKKQPSEINNTEAVDNSSNNDEPEEDNQLENKFDDFFETKTEEEKSNPFDNDLMNIEEEKPEIEEKNKFTQFLLGNEANIPIVGSQTTATPDKKEDVVSYTGPVDESLNVQTGIDKNLENFLFSRRTINEIEKEDEFAPYRKNIEPEEKTFYRASRRKREEPINKTLITDTSKAPVFDEEEKIGNENIIQPEIPNEIKPVIPEQEEEDWEPIDKPQPIIITEEVDYNEPVTYDDEEVVISNLLDELREKSKETGKISILAKYGDDFCSHNFVTNPAIGREREIKELGLILLTPEKSAILVGKPGIGKTSIVEGLAYRIQRNRVPDALKGYRIVSVKTTSLLGTLPSGETRLQTLIDEIKDLDKIILFVDEVHMLMGATNESSLDFANMFKESLGRGTIKMIGATTSDEYERYVLRDKAFVRRFQRVDVAEPTKDQTVEILMGTLPKIEKNTGAKLKYSHYLQVELMTFVVDITSEYKRVYGIGSRYPDICITLVSQAFSEAVFDNRNEVNVLDIRNAIEHSKNIYPDVISKELINFDEKFRDLIKQEKGE